MFSVVGQRSRFRYLDYSVFFVLRPFSLLLMFNDFVLSAFFMFLCILLLLTSIINDDYNSVF